MKNLGTLFGYEMKKLLKRKLSWIVVLVLAGFCVFAVVRKGAAGSAFIIPVFDENGNETGEERVISGEEIYGTYLKTAGALDGRVMDEAFFQEMLESVPDLELGLDSDLYFWTQDATWSTPYSMTVGLFENPRSVTAEEFYARQMEQTRSHLENYGDSRTSKGILSQGEIDYWMEQAEKIQKPFVFERPWRGFTSLTDFFYILFGLLPVAAAVCVCTPFSEDRRDRMDALVFSTRNSRAPLYLAKVLAGAVISALAGVAVVGAVTAAHLAVWGTQGLDAIFQIYYPTNPRPVVMWQVLLPMLMLLVLYTMLCGGVAMLTASITRSSIVALAVPVVLVQILDRWYSMPYGWAGYLPDNLMGFWGPHNMELVKIFGVYLTDFQFGPILYLDITMILLALCWLGWRRNAAGRG